MSFSALFINRPVMTTLVMLAILLFGISAFRQLPMSDLPNVDFPTISVSASLPGASPETMAAAVATPLERQFSTIAGIDSMLSSSSLGGTSITLQFNLTRDIDGAAQDVQAAISRAVRRLPRDMPSPPTYQKVNPADQPILYLALTSPTLPLYELNEYAETLLAQRISTVLGVAQVQVFGSQKYAVRVKLDPMALSSKGISIDEVTEAIGTGNVNMPTGILYGPHRAFTVLASGQLNTADAYRPLIVAYRNGSPVRLGDVAEVIDSVENDKSAAWFFDGTGQQRSMILAVQRQPGTNTVEVAEAVKKLLPTFRDQLPASVTIHILFDRSLSIKESVTDVEYTLLLTLFLVVLVIFLFLRNVSATVIPSLALPMAIVGTFVVMYLCGYSLDNLSLMALTLSVGFVVDDAIVMLENIVRHMEKGKAPFKAAIDGAQEVGFTIVSMTLSLAAVFIPVLFMGGLIGRLFREFAVTIGVAVLVSGFIALTLTPMLASRFLRPPSEVHHGRAYAFSERIYQITLRFYERTLRWVLAHRLGAMVFSVATLAATVWLFLHIPKGFLPSEDREQISGSTEAVEGISYKSMFEHQQAVAAVLCEKPEVASFMSSAGSRGSSGGNNGYLMIRLKPKSQRQHSVDDLIQQWRPGLNSVPGIRVFLLNPPTISIGGRVSRSQYQFTMQSPSTEELYQYATVMEQKIRDLPGFQDVTSDLRMKNPQVDVRIDRDKASATGITAAQIEDALYNAYGSRQVLADPGAKRPVLRDSGAAGSVSTGPLRPQHAVRPRQDRTACPAQCGRRGRHERRAADHQPPGPVALCDGLLQPHVRGLSGRGGRYGQRIGRHDSPGLDHHEFPGHGPGLPVVPERARLAPRSGDPRHLPRAGHPVRELHSSDHHSLGVALRRFWRAGHPDDLRRRAFHLRLRRHRHARRPGEEERHYDGGLRHRGATDRGQESARCDSGGQPHPVPAHHDDHDGGADG